MMLVIESGTAEIDEPNIGPFDSSKVSLLFRIVGDVEIGINEEDVLRFQVRMGQFIVMKESHSVGELVTDMSDLLQRVRLVIVIFLQKPRYPIRKLRISCQVFSNSI